MSGLEMAVTGSPAQVPATSRTRLTVPTMIQRLRLGRWRIRLDSEKGVPCSVLILPPHRTMVPRQFKVLRDQFGPLPDGGMDEPAVTNRARTTPVRILG